MSNSIMTQLTPEPNGHGPTNRHVLRDPAAVFNYKNWDQMYQMVASTCFLSRMNPSLECGLFFILFPLLKNHIRFK